MTKTYVVARLDPGRDLRVGDEIGEEDLPVSEDEVAAAGDHAPLGEHDERRAPPVARQEPPRRVELQRVRVLLGGCKKRESVTVSHLKTSQESPKNPI